MPTAKELREADQKLAAQRKKVKAALKGGTPPPDDALHTKLDIARVFKVSRQTVGEWAHRKDFPEQELGDYWLHDKFDAWLKKNELGPYRQGSGGDGTYNEALTYYTQERGAKEALLRKEKEIDLAIKEGLVIPTEEVQRFYGQTVATTVSVVESFPDAIEREIPEQPVSAEAWVDFVERLLTAAHKIAADAQSTIQELVAGKDGDGNT